MDEEQLKRIEARAARTHSPGIGCSEEEVCDLADEIRRLLALVAAQSKVIAAYEERPPAPEERDYKEERWCKRCEKKTLHVCHDSGHERDSSGDSRCCLVCGLLIPLAPQSNLFTITPGADFVFAPGQMIGMNEDGLAVPLHGWGGPAVGRVVRVEGQTLYCEPIPTPSR